MEDAARMSVPMNILIVGNPVSGSGRGRQLMDSIYTKLMVLPDSIIVCPGHGPETTIGREQKSNPYVLHGL